MLPFRRCALMALGVVGLVGVVSVLVALDIVPHAFAFPLLQFPLNSVTLISDPPPPDLPGQFSETTLLQDNFWDPDPLWRSAEPNLFDDSSWLASYPVVTRTVWGPPVGGAAPPADFIWGGSPGAGPDANGRYNIPSNPIPQYLFLRKNFCIPINASLSSIAVVNPLRLEVATTNPPGLSSAAVYYNGAPVATGLDGREDGFVYDLNLAFSLVDSVRRVGRNTLAMRVRDNVDDASAAVAYGLQFNYAIDPSAITVSGNPPSPSVAGTTVVFNQSNNGLSGDGPFTFGWDFGDGTTSTDSAPSHVYSAPGTYTVTLVMTDSVGCPSAPVTVPYVVQEVPTPTPTVTVVPPTNTPAPPSDSEPAPPPASPTNTPVPSPTPTPTSTPEVLAVDMLPETGNLDRAPFTFFTLPIVGGILLLIAGYFLIRCHPGWHD